MHLKHVIIICACLCCCFLIIRYRSVMYSYYLLFLQSSIPVNGSKSVEVLQHDTVKVFKAIQFPEVVQVGRSILPQSRNLTERPDHVAV